jgi:hypothetical protein
MGNRVQLDPKLSTEIRQYSFNFLSKLQSGETISTASCSVSVYSGNDPTPSAIITGAASMNGPVVNQLVSAGVVGTIYEIDCEVTTSLGQTLDLLGYLAVIPSSADAPAPPAPSVGQFVLTPGGQAYLTPSGQGILTP